MCSGALHSLAAVRARVFAHDSAGVRLALSCAAWRTKTTIEWRIRSRAPGVGDAHFIGAAQLCPETRSPRAAVAAHPPTCSPPGNACRAVISNRRSAAFVWRSVSLGRNFFQTSLGFAELRLGRPLRGRRIRSDEQTRRSLSRRSAAPKRRSREGGRGGGPQFLRTRIRFQSAGSSYLPIRRRRFPSLSVDLPLARKMRVNSSSCAASEPDLSTF